MPEDVRENWLESLSQSLVYCTLNPGDALFNVGDVQDTAFLVSQVRCAILSTSGWWML